MQQKKSPLTAFVKGPRDKEELLLLLVAVCTVYWGHRHIVVATGAELQATAMATNTTHLRLFTVLFRSVACDLCMDIFQYIHVYGPHGIRWWVGLAVGKGVALKHGYHELKIRILSRSSTDRAKVVVPNGEGDQEYKDRQTRYNFAAVVHCLSSVANFTAESEDPR
jgi:hypothetical protein